VFWGFGGFGRSCAGNFGHLLMLHSFLDYQYSLTSEAEYGPAGFDNITFMLESVVAFGVS